MNFNNNFNFNNNMINNNKANNQKNNNNRVKDIFLTFTFEKYNKQNFLEVNGADLFTDVCAELEDKYSWLKDLNNRMYYYFKNTNITKQKISVNKFGLKDNSNIVIKIKDN